MSFVENYKEYVKNKSIENPEKAWGKILLGIEGYTVMRKVLPNKEITKGYQKLESLMLDYVAKALLSSKNYVWGNIFAPCEIFENIGYSTLSVEVLACFLSTYHLEEYFIDHAQSIGITPTLCSYHKSFIGSVSSGIVPVPEYGVTTSLSCDGNLNTFRFMKDTQGVPFTLLDIPYHNDAFAVEYLKNQLIDMVKDMEETLGKKLDINDLKKSIEIENETWIEIEKFYDALQTHYYPGEIIHQLFLMMAVHLMIGRKELLDLMKFMNQDIMKYPPLKGKVIFWIHLLPFYQESIKEYFNCSEKYQLVLTDLIMDGREVMDPDDPYGSLAQKLLNNLFNGSYRNKASFVKKRVQKYHPDAVIHFCHWGCKQSDGGSILLKEAMSEENVPCLILDGDGIDHRNSHDGQIKTRLEAFLEMIEKEQ